MFVFVIICKKNADILPGILIQWLKSCRGQDEIRLKGRHSMKKREGYKLRLILGLLVTVTVLFTAAVSGYWALRANVRALSSNYLESNYQYALKLAANTSNLLEMMQHNVSRLAGVAGQTSFSQRDLELWFQANEQYFNSMFTTDAERRILTVTPSQTYSLVGSRLNSKASVEASVLRMPMISEPYVASTGRLILLVSSPIFGPDGQYQGMVGGTLYLQENNALSRLLEEHFYGNGSYVYVVDEHSHLIFHPESRRINEKIHSNDVVKNVIGGASGSAEIINTKGISFFAGYAFEPNSKWGIVSQTPASVLEKPVNKLILNMMLQALPVLAIILLVAWRVSFYISRPLYQIARYSKEAAASKRSAPPEMPKSGSWIYEVKQLYQSIGTHLNRLNEEIQIDGLTGVANRKTFDLTLQEWLESREPFALILLDIDNFKQINDTHGHAVGDEVLRMLASRMRLTADSADLCFRYGGEEFGILAKGAGYAEAVETAERLRTQVMEREGPNGIKATVSVGIAVYHPYERLSAGELLNRADAALYQSKQEGKNRVSVFTRAL